MINLGSPFQMAEALALSAFGPGDLNHSLNFSNRESLGKIFLCISYI